MKDSGDSATGHAASAAIHITAGFDHTCAGLDNGAVRCWGRNSFGVLGYGNTDSIGTVEPASAGGDVPLGGVATAIAAGGLHTCALLDTGAVRCRGHGGDGRLG